MQPNRTTPVFLNSFRLSKIQFSSWRLYGLSVRSPELCPLGNFTVNSTINSPLRRIGNKKAILPQLLGLFPDNITTFIDMFFGTGVVSFAMVERAKYIIANDNDDDVFNLFMVLKDRKAELEEAIKLMPKHESLFKYWKTNQEQDSVWKATRFLMLSNFSLYKAKCSMMFYLRENHKQLLLNEIDQVYHILSNVTFMSKDFKVVLSNIHTEENRKTSFKNESFVYADPPYLGTMSTYDSFTEQDTGDLFEILVNSGFRFAISEFDHPLVIELANRYGLIINNLGERRNLGNRRTELLITNYNPKSKQIGLFN